MTMDSADTVTEISHRLFKSREIVTYSSLSAALHLSIDQSKHVLADFYRANKHKAKCNFLISGTKDSSRTFKIVSDDMVDKAIGEFASVDCVHVYSLVSNDFDVSHQDISLHELAFLNDHSKIDQLVKNGMIRGPALERSSDVAPPVVPTKRPAQPTKVEEPKATKKVKSAGLTSKYVSRKAGAKTTDNQPKVALPKKSEPTASSYSYKSRKPQNQDKVVISDVHEEPEEEAVPAKKSATNSTDLQNMFDDDFSDAESSDVEPDKETKPVIQVEEETRSEPDEDPAAHVQEESKVEEPEVPVMREEVDDDGYIVSYKTSETKRRKTAKAPVNKPSQRPVTESKQSSTKKKQTSLMNFFGKKGK